MISEDEQEFNEKNAEIDGVVKFKKDVRGYDEQGDDKGDSSSELDTKAAAVKEDQDAQPLRETHAKFKEFIRHTSVDIENNTACVDISFPLDFKKVLMLTIAESTLEKVLVRSVPNIEKCTLIKPKNEHDEPYLIVQGLNFDAFFPHQDIIDVNRIETNHSYALKAKYGVEAMRANIVKEIVSVFGAYGIAVDKRHLSLIGDFMTFNGDYRAFNRIGMEESSSPFLKMSYETTMKYLVSASQANERDNMSAPSSAIVMGQIPHVGTGMFDLIQ